MSMLFYEFSRNIFANQPDTPVFIFYLELPLDRYPILE